MTRETKVICPVCGSEVAIGAHEHQVSNATVIGADSGLGTIHLPISKRGDALRNAGIDTSKYFSINLPTGGTQMMKMNDNGIPEAVAADDPVIAAINQQGYVPNRNLFRRWIMSQTFHGLSAYGGYSKWLKSHGFGYTWKMFIEELRVQAKLYGRDNENFSARNRWFNKKLALEMSLDCIEQFRTNIKYMPRRKCKGLPYVTILGKHYFVSDVERKLIAPMEALRSVIANASSPMALYLAVRKFWCAFPERNYFNYRQCAAWKDAFKGMGAYATMQNLLRFHGCHFPKDNMFYVSGKSDLSMLEHAAEIYEDGEGWRLFGLMKQMLTENGVEIKAKMAEWREAKRAKNLRR